MLDQLFKALHYLVQNSDMYKECDIQIDEAWLTQLLGKNPENALYIKEEFCTSHNINTNPVDLNIQNINDTDSDEEYNEIGVEETYNGNTDTILQTSETDVSSIAHIIALGEGNIPAFNEPLAEYLSFPTIFCGKTRPTNRERLIKTHTSEIIKWELCSAGTRVALHIPNILCPWSCKEIKQ